VAHVSAVHVHRVSTRLLRPFVTAVRRAETLDSVVVEVRDSEGRSGWGEAPTSWRVTGESVEGVTAVVEQALAPAVRGLPVDDPAAASRALERAAVANNSARMAVDCALYDLAAQHAGLPLWRYLGGYDGAVTTDMTLSMTSDSAELLATAREHVAAGFDTLKVKAGATGPSPEQLRELRDAVGAGVTLRVDANQAWSVEQAVATIQAAERLEVGLELVEQPVPRDDIHGLAQVARRVSTPVLADESVWTRRQLLELLRTGPVPLVNIKLAKTGGIREALAVAELARDRGVGVLVGCMLESHVGITAAASLAAAVATTAETTGLPRAQDLDGGLWLAASPVVGGAVYDRSRIVLPDAPGLGIAALVSPGSGAGCG